MNRTKFLTAALLLLAACAYKLPEAQVLKIFERHSFAAHDPEKLRALIREKGLPGLKEADGYAEVLIAGRRAKASPARPAPSAGMLAGGKGSDFYLLRVFKGSPAETAGLRGGDRLLAVNSFPAGSPEFLAALAGSPEFRVKAARRGKDGVSEFEADVKGGEFVPPQVFGFYDPETRAAFVRVGLLFRDSAAIAAEGLDGLRKYGARSVVLDLRGNPGGNPEEAAALLKLFAPGPGPLLAVASRHQGYARSFAASEKGRFHGLRLVVLADGGTAMAAEVLAASLKELAGAQVAGERTAGNVSVLKTFSLGEGRGLQLTVARLVSSAGKDLEGAGLTPDVPAPGKGLKAWSEMPADALLKDAAWLKAAELLRAR